MPRLRLAAAALIIATGAAAETLVDTLPAVCDEFTYILRIKARSASAIPASITFAGDPATIALRIPALADAADAGSLPTDVEITATDTLGRIIARAKAHTTIDPLDRGFTIRLSANSDGLSASIGGPHEEGRISIPGFNTKSASAIRTSIPDGTPILRHTLRTRALDPVERAPFPTIDALHAYLAASTDPHEGLYAYLDKDIPLTSPAAISRPEAYKFAITRHPHIPGAYTIIHLESTHTNWQPLEIKGSLHPTAFINHYNLSWTDANRRPHTTDTYAQYNENSSILTLTFPLLPATIRLTRINYPPPGS